VSLNFNSDREAEEFAVLTGEARIVSDAPRGDDNPEYLEKYRDGIAGIGMTPEGFGRDFSVAIRVTPTKMRGA
jgi:PPOX class probable F420-dependent enzyme